MRALTSGATRSRYLKKNPVIELEQAGRARDILSEQESLTGFEYADITGRSAVDLRGFRGAYLVYGPAFERIRKLDRRAAPFTSRTPRPSLHSRESMYQCIVHDQTTLRRHKSRCKWSRSRPHDLFLLRSFPLHRRASFFFFPSRPGIYALFYSGVVKLSALITLVDKRALSFAAESPWPGFG